MLTLAGLRRSELLGLRWTDFDPRTGRTHRHPQGAWPAAACGDTKTARGQRVLPLDQERVDLLEDLQRAGRRRPTEPSRPRSGFIAINELGRPMRPEDWTRRWRKLCKATDGVRSDHTLHAARHSTVTFMRNAGVPDHIVAAWHGHDEVVMRQTYSHVHVDKLMSAASALSLRPPKKGPNAPDRALLTVRTLRGPRRAGHPPPAIHRRTGHLWDGTGGGDDHVRQLRVDHGS